ncbi:tetratricopeptide repeat protein [Stieleria sp. TO1_6]|uniref:tetratricopeptide repeat protein n=1 Tax=Stieleria tagensis TaxID=2956795 RepID=UPI00209A93D0|nr:tetratricopeptide repeat protein [Stieleria tagensis]MCO8123223.1 tetratricopeptide repeat protein [Stieleria tagensis]
MPTTINGIGTQYYGKKNPRSYDGVCDSCQRPTKLTDYETGYYFVVLFIPIIPLGKKQILGDCASCRRHRAMPLREWERIREESLDSGLSDLADNMHDPSKAIELLDRMTVFNQMDEAYDLATATAKQHADDFDTQLALGSWYERQGQTALSDKCFATAIELQPNHPASKRIQGVDAISAGRPKDAAEHFDALRNNVETYDPSLFYMLAMAYQSKQMHGEALDEFQDLIQRNPGIGKDKTLRKAVKQSEKAVGKTESILPKKGLFG